MEAWPTCACGCGEPVPARTFGQRSRGTKKGDPCKYVRGHQRRKHVEYTEDPETGCWLWQKAIGEHGYGVQYDNAQMRLAHRVMYERHRGAIPEGMCIDHLCRVRACVNPEHLEAVTQAENNRRGLNTVLTEALVTQIRASSLTNVAWAERLGVTAEAVRSARVGESWKEVAA